MSVVVPTWQRAPWLERCLNALRAQEQVPDEVMVVGRAEDEAAKAVALRGRDWSPLKVRWLEVDAPGHVAPLRRGLEEVPDGVVAFLDDDTEPDLSWLVSLLAPFADPAVSTVGGRVVTSGTSPKMKVSRDAGQIRWYGKYPGNVGARTDSGPVEVDGVMEGNCAWRSPILRSLEFDPVLDFDDASMYGLDLCLQAKARGYRVVYQPAAGVLHHRAPRQLELDRGDRARRTIAYSRNYTYIALKHSQGFRRLSFVIWWWLIGDRGSYGAAAAALQLLRRRSAVGQMTRASFRGKRQGARLWLGL